VVVTAVVYCVSLSCAVLSWQEVAVALLARLGLVTLDGNVSTAVSRLLFCCLQH
jgi:hypothetical protein